jgi:hypothetical protein
MRNSDLDRLLTIVIVICIFGIWYTLALSSMLGVVWMVLFIIYSWLVVSFLYIWMRANMP